MYAGSLSVHVSASALVPSGGQLLRCLHVGLRSDVTIIPHDLPLLTTCCAPRGAAKQHLESARLQARLKAEPWGALPFGIGSRGTCNAFLPNPARALERFIWVVRPHCLSAWSPT